MFVRFQIRMFRTCDWINTMSSVRSTVRFVRLWVWVWVIISAKVSHHSGKVSHLKKLGGFVCKYSNLFDISLSQRFSLEFKAMF